MIAADPRVITRAQALADRIVQRRDLRPPVDVRSLVEEIAEIREIELSGDLLDDAIVHGLHSRGRPTLLLNASRSDRRRRFTLAHELGHLSMAWHTGTISCHPSENDEDEWSEDGREARKNAVRLEREADEFASRLLVPRRFVDQLAPNPPAGMLERLEASEVSPEAGIYGLAGQLPPGHVFALLDPTARRVDRWAASYGTVNPGLAQGRVLDDDHMGRLDMKCGRTHHHGRAVWWARWEPAMALTTDTTDWQSILLGILGRVAPEEVHGGPMWRSANGIAAGAHSAVGHQDVEALAMRIRQRFLLRDDFKELVEDPYFSDFASARALAFNFGIKRRKKKAKET